MDAQELKRLVREHYPFPIAHAHKKTLGVLDDDLEKLKCLLETAEVTIQFLALLTLAQVRQDLLKETAPNPGNLKVIIDLKNPSFGKWYGLTRDVIKLYRDTRDHLVVPELFDFWFQNSSGKKLRLQPLHAKMIEPLIALRNDFHHGRVPENQVGARVAAGLDWLHQLLEAVQFLAQYELSFIQRILLNQDVHRQTYYVHDLTLFNGCLYERDRRQFDIHLEPSSLIFLQSQEGRHLLLNPFIVFSDHRKGPDIFLLNNIAKKKVIYVSSQFAGEELPTNDEEWKEGKLHHETLSEFLDLLRNVPQASSLAPGSADILSAPEAGEMPALPGEEEISPLSTTEVFQQRYQVSEHIVEHTSPYKFLDYYNPEDQDIFFGRDKEIRLLEQKFHTTRLLVLHGESGTGKTSLIRAGLIPRLSPEVYVPVYIRVLKEPLQEIKRELLHQLGLDEQLVVSHEAKRSDVSEERHSTALRDSLQTIPLAKLLRQVTEQVSKTVIIVLDQFEEFFLRFPEEIRQQFEEEFATCIETSRLDVKILISLRADYFSYLASFEDSIPQIFTHQVQLERLTEAQALEAVVKPAERLGIQVDEVMVQVKLLPELISEEGGPLSEHGASIEPPLLQIVCDALYQNAQSEGRQEIGMADYEAIGDVKGALGRYLEEKLCQFGKNQRVAKVVLKALVTAEGTKRVSFLEELVSRVESMGVNLTENADRMSALPGEVLKQKYLDKFVRHRLVRVEDVEGEARYELSHEYLVKHIEAWIKESEREVTKVLELIDRAYEAYQATGLLLESSALQMIKPFEQQLILPAEKQTFVNRSKTQVRKQRRGLLLKVASLLMFVAIIVGSIFGYQTYQQYQETIRQRDIAITKQQEAEEQRQEAEKQRQRSEQQRQKAEEQRQIAELNSINALYQTSKVLSLSNDQWGALFAGVKAGKILKHLDVPAKLRNQILFHLQDIAYDIYQFPSLEQAACIAFSPDSTILALGTLKGYSIKLWDVKEHREITTLYGHRSMITRIVFSPDGTLFASESLDGTFKLWHIADNKEILTYQYRVKSLTFSPDGTLLAAAAGNAIKLWKVPDSKEISTLARYSQPVKGLRIGDLHRMSKEENERWMAAQKAALDLEVTTLHGHSGSIEKLTFSPDGTLLASRSKEEIKLWNIADGSKVTTLKGHRGLIYSVAFNGDGTLLASGSGDETVKLWDVSEGKEIRTFDVYSVVYSVAFSPDGKHLAAGIGDRTIKLWNVADGQEIRTLQGHADEV